jgi:hypothetical protein
MLNTSPLAVAFPWKLGPYQLATPSCKIRPAFSAGWDDEFTDGEGRSELTRAIPQDCKKNAIISMMAKIERVLDARPAESVLLIWSLVFAINS